MIVCVEAKRLVHYAFQADTMETSKENGPIQRHYNWWIRGIAMCWIGRFQTPFTWWVFHVVNSMAEALHSPPAINYRRFRGWFGCSRRLEQAWQAPRTVCTTGKTNRLRHIGLSGCSSPTNYWKWWIGSPRQYSTKCLGYDTIWGCWYRSHAKSLEAYDCTYTTVIE